MTTVRFTDVITEESEQREIFGKPSERSLNKQIDHLDQHCREIISKSPFILLGTSNSSGLCDVSPKGDFPGFVRVLDDKTVAIPDLPGNNRLDTLANMLDNPHVGLIFLIPGMNETLRINGNVRLIKDADLLESMSYQGKLPILAIVVDVEEVFIHCPKAFMRSKLWSDQSQINRNALPSMAEILRDHADLADWKVEALKSKLSQKWVRELH